MTFDRDLRWLRRVFAVMIVVESAYACGCIIRKDWWNWLASVLMSCSLAMVRHSFKSHQQTRDSVRICAAALMHEQAESGD